MSEFEGFERCNTGYSAVLSSQGLTMAAGKRKAAVTGAFSYTGQYVARALMQRDWEVITLTRNPSKPHPLQGKIKAFPLDFSNPKQLRETLLGVEVLVNTYWVRFNYPGSS